MNLSSITDKELDLLQLVIFEARFCEVSNNEVVWISPLVADMHEAIVNETRRRMISSGNQKGAARIEAWLKWSSHGIERRIVIKKLNELPYWINANTEEKIPFLAKLIKPFTASLEDLQAFSEEIAAGRR